MKLYHEMKRDCGDVAARSLIRKALKQRRGNISAVSRELGCSRLTVRRARDGNLEDLDRTPKSQPNRVESSLESFVLVSRAQTGYGKRRLRKYLKAKYGILMGEDLIGKILKRNKVKKQQYKRSKRQSKPLYDYEALLPFEEGQVDTKHIDDFGALGPMVFRLRRYGLPLYQWTYVCAKTKVRFLAYSHELGSALGILFMSLVMLWLRLHGIDHPMNVQGDNGSEFCGGSKRKEEALNRLLDPWNASFLSIPAGKKYLQGIVERSHRTDDEEFYRPHLEKISSVHRFLEKAQRWQNTYNSLRPSFGIDMEGKTPLETLEACGIMNGESLLRFPVILLDDLLSILGSGKYLCNHYHFKAPNLI